MNLSYKGVLHGNRIEWANDAGPKSDLPISVEVTVVDSQNSVDQSERGRKMASVLERLAAAGAFDTIADPLAWQREQRTDRELPGRS